MPNSDALRRILLAGALLCAPASALADGPARVVSMNLCTDQLAMLMAAPGQLHSVSYLAADPRGSAMADQARAYPVNHGLAEEVYLMQPDLVLAGTYTSRATVDMLRRLGVPVETFEPSNSLQEVRDGMIRMGAVLGQSARAAEIVAAYDADLAAFQEAVAHRPRAALYAANSYTSGDRTLAGQILATAGLANVAAEAGYDSGGILPLEVLVMAAPEAVITGRPFPGASRSEEVLRHPALLAMQDDHASGHVTDRDWVCGTPYVLRAVAEMAELRRTLIEVDQ
ncbi:ABC transporter substrate-binding protein [Gemmobacter fulvus]|uniref:ABC transporter substrate-binding protein n=1 Tax=Gemmobacter fulvus TaxID=2840474 RepID=A0A975S0P6_9RHOB|nr:ABC transporter substrate-binding protein [Gemmobacter fulvus]MBT9246778.1 ABC transporter substrate-binding protein [Gemmobacter fulvus]MDQ1846735.1 ABC transporter substrate-binding protein [Gemmobacter fulvus]QWK89123.1 ABC transporter substrate-binding protein [Gemmobacter fulvus]